MMVSILLVAYFVGSAWGYWVILMDSRAAIERFSLGDPAIAFGGWITVGVVALAYAPFYWPLFALRGFQRRRQRAVLALVRLARKDLDDDA